MKIHIFMHVCFVKFTFLTFTFCAPICPTFPWPRVLGPVALYVQTTPEYFRQGKKPASLVQERTYRNFKSYSSLSSSWGVCTDYWINCFEIKHRQVRQNQSLIFPPSKSPVIIFRSFSPRRCPFKRLWYDKKLNLWTVATWWREWDRLSISNLPTSPNNFGQRYFGGESFVLPGASGPSRKARKIKFYLGGTSGSDSGRAKSVSTACPIWCGRKTFNKTTELFV